MSTCELCASPGNILASNITTSSADLSWAAGGSETSWLMTINGTSTVVSSSIQALTGLTPNTNYTIQLRAICGVGDTSALSPAYTFTTSCGIATAPYLENFDAGFSNCWSQDTADTFDWTVDAGGTPSGGTGPSDDFTGGGNYMYTEASLPRAYGDSAIMYTEEIDISSLTNPELNFHTHMFGSAMGTMSIDVYDGNSYTNVFTKSGDQGDQWVEEIVLLNVTSDSIHFKIKAVLDSNAGGQTWPGDMAIDDFRLREFQGCTVYGDTTVLTACDSYTWSGNTYTASGIYYR